MEASEEIMTPLCGGVQRIFLGTLPALAGCMRMRATYNLLASARFRASLRER